MSFEEDYNYLTKNRKLKLEEYNDDGELIDVVEFDSGILFNSNEFYFDVFSLGRKKDRQYFTGKKLILAKRILTIWEYASYNSNKRNIFTVKTINAIEEIFQTYSEKEIEFTLDFKNYNIGCGNYINDFMTVLKDINRFNNATFEDMLQWVNQTDGIFYAVSDNGEKGMLYFETPPTKKQAQYQRKNNDKKIVFLDFKTWKIHLINESELI